MATRPQTTHSHPICPTCQSDLTGREELPRFCAEGSKPLSGDDVYNLYEETETLLRCLGALAYAIPLAVRGFSGTGAVPSDDWLGDIGGLAEELTAETRRRLSLLRQAGLTWRQRAEGKEG